MVKGGLSDVDISRIVGAKHSHVSTAEMLRLLLRVTSVYELPD